MKFLGDREKNLLERGSAASWQDIAPTPLLM